MAKRLGAEQGSETGELSVDCLKGLSNYQAAEQVAQHFIEISPNCQLSFQHLKYFK